MSDRWGTGAQRSARIPCAGGAPILSSRRGPRIHARTQGRVPPEREGREHDSDTIAARAREPSSRCEIATTIATTKRDLRVLQHVCVLRVSEFKEAPPFVFVTGTASGKQLRVQYGVAEEKRDRLDLID